MNKYEENFLALIFRLSSSFYFEIPDKYLKIRTKVSLVSNKYIFQLEFYKNNDQIEIYELTEQELKSLSKHYGLFVSALVNNTKMSFSFYLKLFLTFLARRRKRDKLLFSRDIITIINNQSRNLEFVVTKDYLLKNIITIIPNNLSLGTKHILKYFHSPNIYLVTQSHIKRLNLLSKAIISVVRWYTFIVPFISSFPGTSNLLFTLIDKSDIQNSIIIFISSIIASFIIYIILKNTSESFFKYLLLKL